MGVGKQRGDDPAIGCLVTIVTDVQAVGELAGVLAFGRQLRVGGDV